MDKLEHRAVIKFFVLNGLKSTEIYAKLLKVYKDCTPSICIVKKWVSEFRHGRTSLKGDLEGEKSKTGATDVNTEKVHNMVLDDRRLKVYEISKAIGLSEERVRHILHNELGVRKLCTRWVPISLNADEKQMRKRMSQHGLNLFEKNPTEFMRRFVTTDETWVHHYTPETREQSKQWAERGSSLTRKGKSVPSIKKIMASVFWDAKGIILIDYLDKGRAMNGEYFSNLLDRLEKKISETRPGLHKKEIILHQDNALHYKKALAMGKIRDFKFELLEHPPHSPDLAPSSYYLFPKLNKFLAGKRFASNEDVISAVNGYFSSLPKVHFKNGIETLQKRWAKCIELKGDYVDKENLNFASHFSH